MDERARVHFAEARQTAHEQLADVWQGHVQRMQDAVACDPPAGIEQLFEEQMEALAARLGKEIAETRRTAERDLSQKLNQSARRLRHFETPGHWARALVEVTEGFCDRAALFLIDEQSLRLEAAANIDYDQPPESVPLHAAPAFAAAVESRDSVVAMRKTSEMSQTLGELLGDAEGRMFYLFPVLHSGRAVAVLYADGEGPVDTAALELLATLAGAVFEAPSARLDGDLVNIAPAGAKAHETPWLVLSKEDQDLHLRARRFARVQVAEIRLYHSQEVKEGRSQSDLYGTLQPEIDAARDAFQREFLSASDTMVDYLHLELVHTLANENARLLGPGYPGPLDDTDV